VIPRSDVEIVVDVDPAVLTLATPETVRYGIACIHEYQNAVFAAANWVDAEETIRVEAEELARLDGTCSTEDEFDEAAFEVRTENFLDFEFGVSGAVEALCAAGCPTFASCGGHGEGFGGRDRHPWILFASDSMRLLILVRSAQMAGCGLQLDERGLLVVLAPSLSEMIEFGRLLIRSRNDLDSISPMIDRAALVQETDDEDWWE